MADSNIQVPLISNPNNPKIGTAQLTDSSGTVIQEQKIVITSPTVAGNQAEVGAYLGSDNQLLSNTNAQLVGSQPLLFNGTGVDRQKTAGATGIAAVGGAAAIGAAPSGNPVTVSAQGPTGNVALLQVDGSGNLKTVPASAPATQVGGLAPAGSPPSGNPVLVGIWDGTNVQILRQAVGATGTLSVIQSVDPFGANDVSQMRRLLEEILLELRSLNLGLANAGMANPAREQDTGMTLVQ